jgi:hypothetical protein
LFRSHQFRHIIRERRKCLTYNYVLYFLLLHSYSFVWKGQQICCICFQISYLRVVCGPCVIHTSKEEGKIRNS